MIQKIILQIRNSVYNNPYLWLFLCYIIAILGRTILSFFVIHPQSLPDEYYYDIVSQMVADGSLFLGFEPYPSQYPPGYSILISPGHLLTSDAYSAYRYILIINAVISSLIIFPAYAIIQRFTSGLYPYLGALLVLWLPAITASGLMLMSENVFTLIVVLALWVYIKSIDVARVTTYDYVLGILLFLAFFTRTTGISLIIGYLVSFGILFHINKNSENKFVILKKGCISIGVTLLLYCLWCVNQIASKGRTPSGYNTSQYMEQIVQTIIHKPLLFFHTFLLEGQYILIASFVLFFLFSIYWLYLINKESDTVGLNNPEITGYFTGLTSFILISAISLFGIGIVYIFGIIQNQTPYLYGRYIDPIIPVIIIIGTIGLAHYYEFHSFDIFSLKRPYFLIIFGFIIISGLVISIQLLPEPNNNSAVYFWYSIIPDYSWIIVAIIPVLLFSFVFIVSDLRSNHSLFILFCIFIAILSSIPVVNWQINTSYGFASILQINEAIDQITSDHDVIIWETPDSEEPWDTITYYALKYWRQNQVVRADLDFYLQDENNLMITSNNNVTGNWIISQKNYPLNRTMVFGGYSLYNLAG